MLPRSRVRRIGDAPLARFTWRWRSKKALTALALLVLLPGTGACLRVPLRAQQPNAPSDSAIPHGDSTARNAGIASVDDVAVSDDAPRPAANRAPRSSEDYARRSSSDRAAPSARRVDARRPEAISQHVLVISIDGLRPDAIGEYEAETIERLMEDGSYSLQAQTILPSKTLPSHTSMLTGVTPAVHGITWNSRESDEHGPVTVPTIFEVAKEAGYTTAAFFSKAKFRHLVRPGSLDYWQAPWSNLGHWMATTTVPAAVNYLEHARPNLLFVHIAEPDYAGHAVGWMSFVYGWAVKRADAAVARLLEAADDAYGGGNYTVILTADHGGHGRDHGSAAPADMTIPWIVWGKAVRAHTQLAAGIRTMDTAATALWLLGLTVPASWAGQAVVQAFAPVAVAGSGAGDSR